MTQSRHPLYRNSFIGIEDERWEQLLTLNNETAGEEQSSHGNREKEVAEKGS